MWRGQKCLIDFEIEFQTVQGVVKSVGPWLLEFASGSKGSQNAAFSQSRARPSYSAAFKVLS